VVANLSLHSKHLRVRARYVQV